MPARARIPRGTRRAALAVLPGRAPVRARAGRAGWAAGALTVALLAGCGLVAPASDAAVGVVPSTPLADVEPLADVRSWTGEVVVAAAATGIDPVATDPEPALPATVRDAQGTTVTVSDASRILALDLYGSLSRIVFDLGLGDAVVGRDTSSTFDEIADLPLVTPVGHELSAEAILELAPSVIITDTTLGPWDVVLQMREAGIPVVVLDSHRSLENAADLVTAVADALGVPEQGAALAERTRDQIEETTAQIARLAPADQADRLRVAFLYVRGQSGVYSLFGQGSGADSLIASLAATDVATEIGWSGMRTVTDEGLIAAQPDVILMMTGGLESVGGVDGLLEQLPAIAQTPAGRNRRIVAMADTEILAFGPASAAVLDALARALYAPGSLS